MAKADSGKRQPDPNLQQASESGYWYVMTVVPITFLVLIVALMIVK